MEDFVNFIFSLEGSDISYLSFESYDENFYEKINWITKEFPNLSYLMTSIEPINSTMDLDYPYNYEVVVCISSKDSINWGNFIFSNSKSDILSYDIKYNENNNHNMITIFINTICPEKEIEDILKLSKEYLIKSSYKYSLGEDFV